MKKIKSKIARRDAIIGTFTRTVIADGVKTPLWFTDRGVIIENDHRPHGYYLKWADTRSQNGRDRMYRFQLHSTEVESLQSDEYDHLLLHLGRAEYPFCVITRAELLKMGLSGGGCIVVCYRRGNRKFRVAGGKITLDRPLLVEWRRFWRSATNFERQSDFEFADAA